MILPLQQRPHDEIVEREVDALIEECRGRGQRAGVLALTPWRRRHCDRQVLKHRSSEED